MSDSSSILSPPAAATPMQWMASVLPIDVAGIVRERPPVKRKAADKRTAEFAEGRQCVSELMEQFGVDECVGVAQDRSPIWPTGMLGSISHSDAWIFCVVGQQTETGAVRSIGIDTEPVVEDHVREELMDTVATESEWSLIEQFGFSHETAFTILFSAKEAFYKCWFPIVKEYFDFFDVELVAVSRSQLTLKVLPSNPAFERGPDRLKVDYLVNRQNVFTVTSMESWCR